MKEKIINRLRRVEGQVRGIQKMIREEAGCREVLQQVAAARSALFRVGIMYISHGIEDCVGQETPLSPEELDKLRDLMNSIWKM